jgi:hypothetical protein
MVIVWRWAMEAVGVCVAGWLVGLRVRDLGDSLGHVAKSWEIFTSTLADCNLSEQHVCYPSSLDVEALAFDLSISSLSIETTHLLLNP